MDRYRFDSHKLFWHLDRVREWQEHKIIAPIYIEISPVARCNHQCSYCALDFARNGSTVIDTAVLCEKLREMGQLNVRSVMFAGEGEPLLHRDFPMLVKTTRESGMDVALSTNGTLGNYELWKTILAHLSWIRFSVDAGTPEVYSRVHRVHRDVFAQTLSSIEEAVMIKKKYALSVTMGVQFLILQDNIRDIENALVQFSKSGIDYFVLKPFSRHPLMSGSSDIVYTEEHLSYIQGLVQEYSRSSNMDIIFRKETMRIYMEKARGYTRCHALPFWGYISSSGDFYTCSVFIKHKEFLTGNIYENTMEEIFFGEKRRKSIEYGEELLDIKECRVNCRMARINEFLQTLQEKPEHINFI
ncbi:MAG: radical SAM protein [Geobacter sp.]|nr:MAG: radical SAM protein [Geobacter sp.]